MYLYSNYLWAETYMAQNARYGDISKTVDGTHPHQGYASTSSLDDWREWSLALSAGTYTLKIGYYSGPNSGIITPSLNGTNLTTLDAYNSSNQTKMSIIGNISVTSSGIKVLRFKTTSKNESSSGYDVKLTFWSLTRTDVPSFSGTLGYPVSLIQIHPTYSYATNSNHVSLVPSGTGATISGANLAALTVTIGDSFSWYLPLDSGTWKMTWIGSQGTNYGIYDITLNDVMLATVDMYNASGTTGVNRSYSNISVANSGNYILKFTNTGKNPSSSGRAFASQFIQFRKTA